MKIPQELVHEDARYVYQGPGQGPGALLYLNLNTGQHLQVHEAGIVGSNLREAKAAVVGNRALSQVDVAHDVVRNSASGLREGDAVLIAIRFGNATGPVATAAWMVETARSNHKPMSGTSAANGYGKPPINGRLQGWIKVMKTPTYGFLEFGNNRPDAFFHRTQVRNARYDQPLQDGMRVECRVVEDGRGPTAVDVRLIG